MTNTSMSTRCSVVWRQVLEILGSYYFGISMYDLACFERSYQQKFKRPLNYKSLGVKNIKALLEKLVDKKEALLIKQPQRKEEYLVISASHIEKARGFLKFNAQELLDAHSGEIPFTSFEDLYMERFGGKLNYHRHGLTNLDHLCEVFNDILVVEENSSGDKVIKAAEKVSNLKAAEKICYNLRKRKRNE